TVLTVLHAAAQAAAAVCCDDLAEVASTATAAAAGALADTPRQLAALGAPGVVDAGGRGLTLLLEALLAVVSERPGARPAANTQIRPSAPRMVQVAGSSTAYEYEVMYLLDGAGEAEVIRLRGELSTLGDCVAVVGTTALWKVHVHCSDVDAAIDAGRRAGRPHRITVMRFADQVLEAAARDRYHTDHAVLVLAGGTGLAQLCRREGAVAVPATSSAADLLEACAATHARHVTMLAETSATTAAEAAAAQPEGTGQDVVVVVAGSAVQLLAAVAVHDAARPVAEDRAAMTDAATATRYGELTTRDGLGGFVGILDGEAVVINRDLLAASRELVARLLIAGGELLTVLLGQDAPSGFAAVLTEQLRAAHPKVEMMCYAGDVPQRVLLVGVE
ncbi:MAG TPA: DAK2 domain-containing protein, partial [Pseudonocardiaceae bacterium]|nr:DAK2 domain-containing protein [Pseudonocardiaceae bacterium]